jgi:hypothetical protein
MLVFWVFVPGPVLLILGLLYFNWRNRRQQLVGNPSLPEITSEESAG